MNDFTVYPAIDLRGGQVVRLSQGDPSRQTTYSNQASAVAGRWLEAGADWLHIVNLDGAFGDADLPNQEAITALIEEVKDKHPKCQIQLGGGLRTLTDIAQAFKAGLDRVILGTMAIEDPTSTRTALADYGGDRVVIGIDVREGQVAVRGWTQTAHQEPAQLGLMFREAGATTAVFTDIRRDGMGVGAAVTGAANLAKETGLEIIVAGGVHALSDIVSARKAGLGGVIIGRALYEGHIDLQEALAC